MSFSLRLRLMLALLGLALVIFSLAALVYAFGPGASQQVHAPLIPTLFVSP